jgi:hypothetical protein
LYSGGKVRSYFSFLLSKSFIDPFKFMRKDL